MAVVVAQVVTTDREVRGLIPTGSWAFFLVSFSFSSLKCLSISGVPLIRSLVKVQHYCYFQRKMEA